MITVDGARKAALALPEVEEKSHFHLPDFRINNKIFASLHKEKQLMMVRLSPVDQFAFCSYNKGIIFPVPGSWGKKGATFVDLKQAKIKMLKDALISGWKYTAPVKIVSKYFPLK